MRNGYWQRKRDMENGTIRVHKHVNRYEFWYKGISYVYEYVATSGTGFAYIYHGTKKIFSPYENQCTELGKEIYNQFSNQILKHK